MRHFSSFSSRSPSHSDCRSFLMVCVAPFHPNFPSLSFDCPFVAPLSLVHAAPISPPVLLVIFSISAPLFPCRSVGAIFTSPCQLSLSTYFPSYHAGPTWSGTRLFYLSESLSPIAAMYLAGKAPEMADGGR